MLALIYTLHKGKRLKELGAYLASKTGILSICILLLSLNQNIYYTLTQRNPFYPLNIKIAGVTLFAGTFDASGFGMGAHTTMGNINLMSLPQKFYAAWTDIFNNLNVDSFGSIGAIYILAILFGFLIFGLSAIYFKNFWHRILSFLFIISLAIPGFFHPRYSIPMLAIAIVGALYAYTRSMRDEFQPILHLSLSALGTIGLIIPSLYMHTSVNWISSNAGTRNLLLSRNSFMAETLNVSGTNDYPLPEVIKFVHENSHKNELLVWETNGFQGLYWNKRYNNRTIYLPKINDAHGDQAWLSNISNLHPQLIAIYKKDLSQNLAEALHHLGYSTALYSENKSFSIVVLKSNQSTF